MSGEGIQGRVDDFVEAAREELIALCAELVAARSENPPGDTNEAAAVVQGFLGARGLDVEIAARVPEKPNVIVPCTGHDGGSDGGRHLVFNGHIDTILPGEESEWTVPVYELTRRQGRLYGHGMGNMKGAVAAMCLAQAFLAAHRELWAGRVTLTFVADETVFGPDGAAYLLETRPELVGDSLICGEGPGFMDLAIAEKGVLWVEVEARARSGQGMLTRRGTAAPARLAQALSAIDAINDEHAIAPAEARVLALNAGEHGLRVSANIGVIEGGQFVSQVASRAAAQVDIRVPPGLTIGDMEARLSRIVEAQPDMSWRRIKGWEPNWTSPDEPVVRAVAAAAEATRGTAPRPVVRLPASDASRWRALGTPAVCYGPQPTLAAGVDDYAEEQDVIDCAKIYALAALRFLDGGRA